MVDLHTHKFTTGSQLHHAGVAVGVCGGEVAYIACLCHCRATPPNMPLCGEGKFAMETPDRQPPTAVVKKKPTLSLVLGSGGARGMAHIGVIRELEQAGFEIASIAGCSVGALVGGVYAAGKLDEFEHLLILKIQPITFLNSQFERLFLKVLLLF